MSKKYMNKIKKLKSNEAKFLIFSYYECGDHIHITNDINGKVIDVKVPREMLLNTIKFLITICKKNKRPVSNAQK